MQIVEWARTRNVWALCKYYFMSDLTQGQEEIVKEVAFDIHKRTVICCMTRYGKSWAVAQGILLWIIMNPGKRIAIIAPTNEKTTIIRNYVAGFVSRSEQFLKLLDLDKSGMDRIRKEVSKKRMTWRNQTEMRTLSAEGQGEALMGFGADKVIVDETCDIELEVYRSKITRMLGDSADSTYVEIGNPNHRDNHMWLHWTDPSWYHIRIDLDEALREGRITAEFIEEQRMTLSEREFTILYKADFPESAADQLIDWKWIESSYKAVAFDFLGEIVAGADIAEQGNDLTVVSIGYRNKDNGQMRQIAIESWGKTDLMPTVGKIAEIINKYKITRITIDANGIGSGVYGRLSELQTEKKINCLVSAFKGGMSPDNDRDKERFLNIKAQVYWQLRSLFEAGKIQIINNKTQVSQLNKMKWELTSAMKIRIRDPGEKEGDTAEMKSPDFSDALNLMCFEGKTPFMMVSLAKQ